MTNKQVIFSDRVVGLSAQNGLVRIDLAVNAGTVKGSDDQTKQRMEVTTQLVMPIDAFANAVAMQQKMLQQMLDEGKKRSSPKAAPAA